MFWKIELPILGEFGFGSVVTFLHLLIYLYSIHRTAYQFVRKASQIYVKNKAYLNPNHEFGIIVLEDEASWYQQFESNPDTVCTVLDHLTPNEQETQNTFDILLEFSLLILQQNVHLTGTKSLCLLYKGLLFPYRHNRITLPELEDPHLPPPYVVRVILVYGRSLCSPLITSRGHQILHSLLQSPYFFFDVLYVHQLPSENNKCEVSTTC
ncbi:hypothetical protein QZH41_014601 [Actinostola sp. cb2023]|nr:hypothetical protein QZH41_014601 [Actinostola sp. cb2023]